MTDTYRSRFEVVLGKGNDGVSFEPVYGNVLETGEIRTVPPTV